MSRRDRRMAPRVQSEVKPNLSPVYPGDALDQFFFSHESAWQYWRVSHYAGIRHAEPSRIRSLRHACTSAEKLREIQTGHTGLDGQPAHLLSSGTTHHKNPYVIMHYMRGQLPEHSFCQVSESIFVASPELAFLEAAQQLSTVEAISIGMQYCGSYALPLVQDRNVPEPYIPPYPLGAFPLGDACDAVAPPPAAPAWSTMQNQAAQCHPLTTYRKLKSYIDSAKGLRGVAAARRALRWIRPGSESPMETVQYLLTCLPPYLGGDGFRCVGLNVPVAITKDAANSLGRATYRPDLILEGPRSRVALDYDGKGTHTSPEAVARDKMRQSDLEHLLGYPVLMIPAEQIMHLRQYGRLAKKLSKITGHRLPDKNSELIKKRARLRRTLLDPNIHHW